MTAILLIGLIVAWIPIFIQFVTYGISKLIFRHSDKRELYSVCLVINAVLCFMLAHWLFVSDDDDFLPGLIGLGAFVGFGITIGIMAICHASKNATNTENSVTPTDNEEMTEDEECDESEWYKLLISDGSGEFRIKNDNNK
ncbi:MAG: hypothetical protein K6B38_07735 [Ruminococcus sp.]|nr:hypothetical protein [Ruminococcus sp.]